MKKVIILIILIIISTNTGFAIESIIDINNEFQIGTQKVKFKDPIFLINDLTYVPVRELSESLRIPLEWNQEKEQVTLDIYNKTLEYKEADGTNTILTDGVLSDENMAKNIAQIILEQKTGRPMEYKDGDYEYFLSVSYSKVLNCWSVVQMATYKGEYFGGGNVSPYIRLNKSTGEVMGLNLYPAWDSIVAAHKKELK